MTSPSPSPSTSTSTSTSTCDTCADLRRQVASIRCERDEYRHQCTDEARLHGLTTKFYKRQKADLSTEVKTLQQQLAAAKEELARRMDAEEGARLAAAEEGAKLNTVVRELRRRLAQVEEDRVRREQAHEEIYADFGREIDVLRRQLTDAKEEEARQGRGEQDATYEALIQEAARNSKKELAEAIDSAMLRGRQTAPSNDPQCVIA